MANDSIVLNAGVLVSHAPHQLIQCGVLRIRVGLVIAAFQLNADTEIIALLPPFPTRDTGMPGPRLGRHKLQDLSGATN